MLHFFAKVVSKGSTVFDVGANIGIYSLLASKRTGADGHVYSFEPSDWAFQRLNENISMNEFKNISVFKVGVSDKKGTASFHVCEDDAYNSIGSTPMQEVKSVKQIDICSIDDICTANNIKRIDIIKIDTEGADLLVLQGARGMLNSADPPIVFCEYNKNITSGYAYSLEDYRNYISGIGYKAFEFKNNMLVEFDPAQSASSEIVCIKKEQVSYYSALAKETKCENCSI
jgi:FkbM family methyltransferase